MTRASRRLVLGSLAPAALVGLAAAAPAQVATALLTEDGPVPGAPGVTADSLSNTAVNHVGGYAISINCSDSLSRVWGNASGGPGGVLRTEGTFGIYTQTSFESFYGMADDGTVAYSPLCTNSDTGSTGLDSVWIGDTPVAVEEEVYPHAANFWWSFGSRPGVTAGGTPYFVGGITDTLGGSTDNRGLFYGLGTTPIYLGMDNVPGLPSPLDVSNTVSFDYRFSANGTNHLAEVQMDGPASTADNAMVYSGSGLMVGGSLVQEGSPVPAVAGGLPGENWDNFDFAGCTEDGKWFFTGDTDGDFTTDEIIVKNGAIVHREGDMLDGYPLNGSIEGAYMNEQGDLAFIWDVDLDTGQNVEALYFNGALVLKEGDPVDLDGDGVVEPTSLLSDFTGISSLTVGDQGVGNAVNIYFTADVDTMGTSTTTDDTEGFFCVSVVGSECFLVLGDGPGATYFEPGSHVFVPQLDDVRASWAVSMADGPEFPLPWPSQPQLAGATLLQDYASPYGVMHFAAQVMMWNPVDFPNQPEQWTNGLYVVVLPDGRVWTRQFGHSTGMTLRADIGMGEDGGPVLRLPFTIPGF